MEPICLSYVPSFKFYFQCSFEQTPFNLVQLLKYIPLDRLHFKFQVKYEVDLTQISFITMIPTPQLLLHWDQFIVPNFTI